MDFVRIQLLCVGKHNDLKLIANFVLDFAGIAAGTHEIHNVFNQKMMTKCLPGPRKRSLGFPRHEIVFAATFYKRFYKGFGTLPFSRNLASPAQVSPDGFRSFILLTVSDGIVCFVSPIVLFINSLVRLVRPGAAFADSLVRIACRRLWELSHGTSKTVPGLPEA